MRVVIWAARCACRSPCCQSPQTEENLTPARSFGRNPKACVLEQLRRSLGLPEAHAAAPSGGNSGNTNGEMPHQIWAHRIGRSLRDRAGRRVSLQFRDNLSTPAGARVFCVSSASIEGRARRRLDVRSGHRSWRGTRCDEQSLQHLRSPACRCAGPTGLSVSPSDRLQRVEKVSCKTGWLATHAIPSDRRVAPSPRLFLHASAWKHGGVVGANGIRRQRSAVAINDRGDAARGANGLRAHNRPGSPRSPFCL